MFAGRVDLRQDDFVEQTQRLRKLTVEIASTGVEVGLEDGRDMTVLIQLANATCTLVNLFRMVGVVAEEDKAVGLNLEVETTVHTTIGAHAVTQFIGCAAIELGHGHSGNAILNVNGYWLAKYDAGYRLDGRDEVKRNLAVLNLDVLSMEVAFGECVVITANALLQ